MYQAIRKRQLVGESSCRLRPRSTEGSSVYAKPVGLQCRNPSLVPAHLRRCVCGGVWSGSPWWLSKVLVSTTAVPRPLNSQTKLVRRLTTAPAAACALVPRMFPLGASATFSLKNAKTLEVFSLRSCNGFRGIVVQQNSDCFVCLDVWGWPV